MKKFLVIAAAVATLAGTSIASAQMEQQGDWYVRDGDGGTKIVVGPANPKGMPLMMSESATAPANCAPGAFWYQQGYDNQITACGDSTAYDVMAPESGQMMANGQAYPAGAMIMRKHQ